MGAQRPSAKELRAVPEADLHAQLVQLQQELWRHRMQGKEGSLQGVHQLSALRRQIARIQTVLNER